MSVINTNVKALYTQAALHTSGRELAVAMQQLSTGKRINSSRDDAAGMAIADRMTQQIRSLNQAVRNAGDAISLIQTAEGATGEISDMLQRMRELAIQAINDTNNGDQRAYLDLEFQQLKQEIVRISDTTEWNGFPVLDGTAGIPQGDMPVFKIESSAQVFEGVNVTSSLESTSESREQQTITFEKADPTTQVVDFGSAQSSASVTVTLPGATDVTFTIASANTATTIGTLAVSALNNDSGFVSAGRLAIDNGDGTITVRYADADADLSGATAAAVTGASASLATAVGGGDILVGGATVSITAGMSAPSVASAVKIALDAATFSTSYPGRVIVDNEDGSLSVTFEEDDTIPVNMGFTSSGTSGVSLSVETASIAAADASFSAGGEFLKAGRLTLTTDPDQAEAHRLVFGPSSANGTLTVGGVSVSTVVAGDTAETVAAKVTAALSAATAFGPSSGRTVTDNADGSITIQYASSDGDVALTTVSNGTADSSYSVFEETPYMGLSASFAIEDGDTLTLSGAVDAANGQITFAPSNVAQVDTLTLSGSYTVGDVVAFTVGENTLSYTVSTADAAAAVTLKESLVSALNNDAKIGASVTATLERDGTVDLTANNAGTGFLAYAVLARATGSTGVISSETATANVAASDNGLVIDQSLTLTMQGASGLAQDIQYRASAVTLKLDRSFDRPEPLLVGDLVINDVSVGPALPTDDTLSNSHTDVSGIAVAAAINRSTAQTGVQAKVNPTVFTGSEMSRGRSVIGTVTINGYTSPSIETVANNPLATRGLVVEAINRMTSKTGVIATDGGRDSKGITLTATDGRNIEVAFNTSSTASEFAARTGLREGFQVSTVALESKVETPINVSTVPGGSPQKAGLEVGVYDSNETHALTSNRAAANSPVAQVSAVTLSGTIETGKTYSVTINGRTKEVTAGSTSVQSLREAIVAAINSDTRISSAVTARYGESLSEVEFISDNPGIEFTILSSTTSTTSYIDSSTKIESAAATSERLNTGDLSINGFAIRGTAASDDTRSQEQVTSSKRDSSAIAIAAAVNASSNLTGVTAIVDPVEIVGAVTVTGLPAAHPETGNRSLYINGFEVEVMLTENESADVRRDNVVAAINRESASHGVTATNNGSGVTLLAEDGRNVSIWYNASVDGLSAAAFGLGAGDEVAQVSTITVTDGTSLTSGSTVTVTIDGVEVTTAAITTLTNSGIASAIKTAIDNESQLTNLTVTVDQGVVTVTSNISGVPFELTGLSTNSTGVIGMVAATSTANDYGSVLATGVRGADADTTVARTAYSSVELVSEKAFTVTAGMNGFSSGSNFRALGFSEGSFGGRSSVEMSPPRVGRMTFQVGAQADQMIYIDLSDFGKNGIITDAITSDVSDWDSEARTIRIDNREAAQGVLDKLDTVIDKVNATRATMGAVMNRLEHTIDNLMNVSMNTEASRSQIEDADYAAASTELARTQIMQQAATAVLAQANASQQNVLSLLQ